MVCTVCLFIFLWKRFPHYWMFVRVNHSPANFLNKWHKCFNVFVLNCTSCWIAEWTVISHAMTCTWHHCIERQTVYGNCGGILVSKTVHDTIWHSPENKLLICFVLLTIVWPGLTLNVRGPSYLGLTRSISWLLMPWLLTSPEHQQPWYWLCRIGRFLSYLWKNFNYLRRINVEK